MSEAAKKKAKKRKQHELLPFLACWAVDYQKSFELNGIHPKHWRLMKKYGAPMERFPIATNAADQSTTGSVK